MFKKDKEYFEKMIRKLSTNELLALMEAITEYGLGLMKVSNKLAPTKFNKGDDVDVQ